MSAKYHYGYKKAALSNNCAKEQSFGDSNAACQLHFNPPSLFSKKGLVFSLVEKYRQGLLKVTKLSDKVIQDVSEQNCPRM